jgi:hypothetical protein
LSLIVLLLIVLSDSRDPETIKSTSIIAGIISLTVHIFILYNLYRAGDNLINVETIQENYTINADELLSKLNVNKSRTGEFADGGIIVYTDENNQHGLICSYDDLGTANWVNAFKMCEEYEGGGFSDWRLPNKDEIQLIHKMLCNKTDIIEFNGHYYWSSTENKDSYAWLEGFKKPECGYTKKNGKYFVRAVRSF